MTKHQSAVHRSASCPGRRHVVQEHSRTRRDDPRGRCPTRPARPALENVPCRVDIAVRHRPQPPQANSRTPNGMGCLLQSVLVCLGSTRTTDPPALAALVNQLLRESPPLLFGDRPGQVRIAHHVRDLQVLDGDPVAALHDRCRNPVERVALPYPRPLPLPAKDIHLLDADPFFARDTARCARLSGRRSMLTAGIVSPVERMARSLTPRSMPTGSDGLAASNSTANWTTPERRLDHPRL